MNSALDNYELSENPVLVIFLIIMIFIAMADLGISVFLHHNKIFNLIKFKICIFLNNKIIYKRGIYALCKPVQFYRIILIMK